VLDSLKDLFALVGRIALAAIFVNSGFQKIPNFEGTAKYIASAGLPLPEVGAAIAIVVELVGGIALVIGYKARWAALALAVFTLAAAIFFHNYWAMPADKQYVQMLMFWKNISITGGMLVAAAFGAGAWSVDGRRR
jgi:putative oxidoreductase